MSTKTQTIPCQCFKDDVIDLSGCQVLSCIKHHLMSEILGRKTLNFFNVLKKFKYLKYHISKTKK